MTTESGNAGLQRLELQLRRTNQHWRKMQMFLLGLAALIIVGSAARQIWFLAAVGALMFAAFWAMSRAVIAKTNWDTNPVLRTLRERPSGITKVKHHVATSSSGGFPHSFFVLSDGSGKSISFRVPDADKVEITTVLKARCPNAKFTGPGFDLIELD